MSDEYKMTKEERKTAELAVQNLHEAVDKLNCAYIHVRDLLDKYGWDIDYDDISKSSMTVGYVALDIVDSIASIDGWEFHKSKREAKR